MQVSLYRAARDHLQQADAILSRVDTDALAVRTVIRYLVTVLDEKSESRSTTGKIVPLAEFRRGRLDL
jgi:hypothetical protein